MKFQRAPRATLKPPLAAMSDIAFQLIIFFMVTATFVNKDALNVELPNSESEQQVETDKMITIQANAEITLLDGEEVEVDGKLVDTLEDMLTTRPEGERVVVMLTAEDLPFQKNVDLIAAIKDAGGQVAIMMEEAAE